MHVTWQTFEQGGQVVEVQFFAPDGKSDILLLFCPGFPGRGGTMFEQRHAAAFALLGYTVGVIKHAGTRLDGPDAPFMVNNAARLMQARQKGDTHLGGGPSTLANWLNEPYVVLDALRNAFSRIDVIGNSFGAVSALWSLVKAGAPTDKIHNLLLLAGAQGHDSDPVTGIMRIWNPIYLSTPAIWERITLDDPMSINTAMRDAYAAIAQRAPQLPEHINIHAIVARHDEILKTVDAESFRDRVMNGRGTISVVDGAAYPAHGLLAHDTPDVTTEQLLEYLK